MTILSEQYNGWTNYATWRVNLEIFDGIYLRDMGWHKLDKYDLAQALKDYAREIIEMTAGEGLALSYAMAFLSDVEWYEIGDFMRDAYRDAYDIETESEEA
jgi:hypothetical protein